VGKQKGVLNKTSYMHQQFESLADRRYEDVGPADQREVDKLITKHPASSAHSLWDRTTVAMTMDVEVDKADFGRVLADAVRFVKESKEKNAQ
jgi:hypothetical protein